MIGKLSIKGPIGSYKDEQGKFVKGVDLIDIVESVKTQRDAALLANDPISEFLVDINSEGGFVDVGFDIYDYLVSIPENVYTVAQGMCASIATIVYFSGNKRKNLCPLIIHNPYLNNVTGDADKLQLMADDTRATEDRIISFYAKHTGLGKMELDALMKAETFITPEQAFKLGFSTESPQQKEILQNYKAVARLTDETMSKETKGLLAKMDEFITSAKNLLTPGGAKPKAMVVVEDGGKSLEITNADGTDLTGKPAAGALVMIDGAPAEGHFVLTEMGVEIDALAGVISEVKEISQAQVSPELEAALKTIEELKAANSLKEKELEENKKDIEAVNAKFATIESQLKAMSGKPADFIAKAQFRDPVESKGLLDNLDESRKKLLEKRAELNKK